MVFGWVQDVAHYLGSIIPPVLACFSDQDARVRYYACESMYNIAKVAKGEILPYFNDIFDALCKVCSLFHPPLLPFPLLFCCVLTTRLAFSGFRAVGKEWRRVARSTDKRHCCGIGSHLRLDSRLGGKRTSIEWGVETG